MMTSPSLLPMRGPNMVELGELIERVEKATGPSRGLDADVYETLGYPVKRRPERTIGKTGRAVWSRAWSYQVSESGRWFAMERLSASLDAVIALVEKQAPGWGWRVATCSVSDDAWLFPDFNSPEHGERLRRDFSEDIDWVEVTDVDRRPPGQPALALLLAFLRSKQEMEK